MKRIVSIMLAVTVLASVSALAAGGTTLQKAGMKVTAYEDAGMCSGVPLYQASDWARDELARAGTAKLIPESLADQNLTQPIHRQDYAAAAVSLYWNLAANGNVQDRGGQTVDPDGQPFTDCTDAAVLEAYRLGLIEGIGNQTFDPHGTLTREQAATILQRVISQSGVKLPGLCGTPFVTMTDTDAISAWAKEGAALMANLGVIQGKPGHRFDPKGTLTGQEALVMNQRLAAQIKGFQQDALLSNTFASDLFAAVKSDEPNKTLSSVSAQYALGLLQAGSQGTTREQLARLLYGVDFDDWNRVLSTTDGGPVVEVANSIWFDTSVTPDPAYLAAVKEQFDARSEKLDLSSQSAVNTVNAWVKDKTHGLIGSILDQPLGDDAAAVLLNALYFKGDWAIPFDANATYDQTFTGASGGRAQVPFMHDTRHGMQYIDSDDCMGVALPYAGGSNWDIPQGAEDGFVPYPTNNGWWMIVLLPKEGTSAESLAGKNFDGLMGDAQDAYVRLSLPKFTVEGSYDLTQPLKDLGLTAAFAGGRDFDPMGKSAKGPLSLSRVIQKTYLQVDEKGTEAAAVTGAVMKTTSVLIEEEPINLTFDRPFLCCLWNTQISQPLFLSVVNELK